jgi:hypothetical protein
MAIQTCTRFASTLWSAVTNEDNQFAANQVYSFATAAFVSKGLYDEWATADLQEWGRDIALHLAQGFLRKDGFFGLKISALNIDVKAPVHGKKIMRILNVARIMEISYRCELSSSSIPRLANFVDSGNHVLNDRMTELASDAPVPGRKKGK